MLLRCLGSIFGGFLLMLGALRAAEGEVRLAGSDLLGPAFTTGVTSFAKKAGLPLKVNLTGSRPGLEALQAGQADLALLVFPAAEKPPGAPYVVRPVAYHTAVVVVPATLPLEQISLTQLRSIFCEDEADLYKIWYDLGVSDEWRGYGILPVLSGSGGGLSYDLFRYTILNTPRLRATVTIDQDGPTALRHISAREGGIAIVPALPPGNKQLKALPVTRASKDPAAFLATPGNLHTGDYPIRLPLNVVFRADAVRRVLPLLRFLYGTDALSLWEGAQVMPLPPQARDGQLAEFDAM